MAKQAPGTRLYEDHRPMLAEEKLDAVVVASPTLPHKLHVIDALKAGAHVLVEKPMARTTADCRKMIEAARRRGKLLMVAHCRRFDPVWGAWAKVVQRGRLGSPILWRMVRAGHGPGGWRMDDKTGGGPLMDGAIHDCDYANWLWGDPQGVTASAIKLDAAVSAVDTISAVVRYPQGNQLLVSISWSQRGDGLSDVLGPKGGLIFGPGPLKPPSSDANKHAYYCFFDEKAKPRLLRGPSDSMAKYKRQAKHFLDCINGKASCICPGREGIKAVAMCEAALMSAATGRARKVTW